MIQPEPVTYLYQNNLKNRNFDKETSHNFDLERMTIVRAQGMSEGQNYEMESTQSKTDSSSCFGIYLQKSIPIDSRFFFIVYLRQKSSLK